jgi:S-disulfanyl-L-cysteine oxidoreductase SoxD
LRIASALIVLLLVLADAATGGTQEAPPGSVLGGIFTAAQAQRGRAAYQKNCATCHGGQLIARDSDATNLSGPDFEKAWVGKTMGDRFERIRTTMPLDDAGSLGAQEYVDILAYILQFNRYPAGDRELKAEPDVLKQIVIEPARKP